MALFVNLSIGRGYSNQPVCVCVSYHLISETTRFQYPDKLLSEGMGCERSDFIMKMFP